VIECHSLIPLYKRYRCHLCQRLLNKQQRTLFALFNGILQTEQLAARTLWNEEAFGCSVGALIPVNKRTKSTRAKLLTDPTWWQQWDKDILYMTANENNAFVGTDRERQKYMLKWTEEMYRKLLKGVNIIEGSDLRVPHFEVTEDGAREREVPEVKVRESSELLPEWTPRSKPELIPV